MIKVSWSQSKRRVCGGALSSGNIASSLEGSLSFRCARIRSITAHLYYLWIVLTQGELAFQLLHAHIQLVPLGSIKRIIPGVPLY